MTYLDERDIQKKRRLTKKDCQSNRQTACRKGIQAGQTSRQPQAYKNTPKQGFREDDNQRK